MRKKTNTEAMVRNTTKSYVKCIICYYFKLFKFCYFSDSNLIIFVVCYLFLLFREIIYSSPKQYGHYIGHVYYIKYVYCLRLCRK